VIWNFSPTILTKIDCRPTVKKNVIQIVFNVQQSIIRIQCLELKFHTVSAFLRRRTNSINVMNYFSILKVSKLIELYINKLSSEYF
jgi:hypothetical protein